MIPHVSLTERLFAAGYDLLNSAVEGAVSPYRRQTAGRAHGDVLEIGAGTGANLAFYPDDLRLTAVEPNPHMARRLVRRSARQGRDVAVCSERGERLSFPDASFDSVVTTLVLCMVDDLDQVLAQVARVLRPGGEFLFYEHVVSPRIRGRRWQERLNPVWKLLTTGCNLDRDITGAIRSAGFASVDVTAFDLSVGLPVTIPNIVGVARR